MKTAVIYARYSSDKQTEQSIEGQLYDCYNYAKANNITVIGEYIDRAMTGRNDDRPDFQRMIADSAKHTFELVLVWKLDRFARSTEEPHSSNPNSEKGSDFFRFLSGEAVFGVVIKRYQYFG